METYKGPVTFVTAWTQPRKPMYTGRLFKGIVSVMMKRAPELMLPAPNPAMERPATKVADDGAMPHRRDPSSKIAKPRRNIRLVVYPWYNFPHIIWVAVKTNRNELPYHPTFFKDWNSSVMRGIAVARTVWSCKINANQHISRPLPSMCWPTRTLDATHQGYAEDWKTQTDRDK